MRKDSLNCVYEFAKENPNVIFIGSDLGPGTLSEFKSELPDQFIMEGISESHVVGMASGLAQQGKTVYINTIGSFLTRRAYEQIYLDAGVAKNNIRLIGNGGGLVYAPLGVSHLAVDDIALMRLVPNMAIVVPCDELQMINAMKETLDYQGPVYIRVAKGNEPVVSRGRAFTFGQPDLYSNESTKHLLITNGVLLYRCINVANELRKEKKVKLDVMNLHTIKPFDELSFLELVEKFESIIVCEEHSKAGGLGEMISRVLMLGSLVNKVKFKHLYLSNKHFESYGSQNDQIKLNGLDEKNIMKEVLDLNEEGHFD